MKFCKMALKKMLLMIWNRFIFVNSILQIQKKGIIVASVERVDHLVAGCLMKQEKICQRLSPAENFLNGFVRNYRKLKREKRTRIMERSHRKKRKRN